MRSDDRNLVHHLNAPAGRRKASIKRRIRVEASPLQLRMDRVHRMSRLPVIVALFAMGIAWSGLELFGETEQFCITLITLLLAVIWYGTRELARGMRDIEDFITLISAEGISFCGALSILVSGPTRYGPSISAFAIIGLGLLVAGCTWGLWNEVSRYITRQVKRR